MYKRIAVLAAAAGLGVCANLFGVAAPAVAAGLQTIYMSPSGSDSASGATSATAVQSLERVEQIVASGPVDQDVEVRIAGGTYVASQTVWQTYRPGHTISFLPRRALPGRGR